MRRLVGEPLLHFLLLGAALFAAYGLINGREHTRDSIIITAGQIDHLTTGFARSWRRPPTAAELQDLINSYVREEVYYREAKLLGLDRDDPVVRRRLQQKLEFLSEDTAEHAEPSDADLSALLRAQAEKFRVGQTVTFNHVYFNPEIHSDPESAAGEILRKLRDSGAAANASTLGDRFLLGAKFDAVPIGEIAKLFGVSFAEQIAVLGSGIWQGPVKSGYGVHLVFVQERTAGRIPQLNEAREVVARDWKETQRRRANEEAYSKLLNRYSVTIELPNTADAGPPPKTPLAQR